MSGGQDYDREGKTPPASVALGGQRFDTAPLRDFQFFEGQGFRLKRDGEFPTAVTATSEPLSIPADIDRYLESQKIIIGHYYPNCIFESGKTVAPAWAEQVRGLRIRLPASISAKPIVMHQIYFAHQSWVYVLTLTILEQESANWWPVFEALVTSVEVDRDRPKEADERSA